MNSEAGLPASFCLEPASRPKNIQSIEVWLQAFHIFVGIYTKKYQHQAPALMKYGQTIQDLASRGQNWRFYDENFRFLRQTQHSLVPWRSIHGELWLRSQYSMNVTRKHPPVPPIRQNIFSNDSRPRPNNQVPWGYCFKFHRGLTCSGCDSHTCFKCQGNHRGNQCESNFVTQKESHAPMTHATPTPTPVKIQPLISLLSGYKPSIVNILISGFSRGFPLHFQGEIHQLLPKNLTSALDNPEIVDMKLGKELAAHRLAGPFSFPPFDSFRVSPLGLVPKKTPGDFRLIHHLSFPNGSSVNDGISPEHTSVHYATVSDAIRLIKAAGHGCFLAKTDIKNAFRIMQIRLIRMTIIS